MFKGVVYYCNQLTLWNILVNRLFLLKIMGVHIKIGVVDQETVKIFQIDISSKLIDICIRLYTLQCSTI